MALRSMGSVFNAHLEAADLENANQSFRSASPFPHICFDNFLEDGFAHEVADSYPSFAMARRQGREFSALNERGKVQITGKENLPEPVQRLNTFLNAPGFLDFLGAISGMSKLLADDEMLGGGMHLMKSGAYLDVHADFNFVPERRLYRRLNLLLFLNPQWKADWGGELELWDRKVRRRGAVFLPSFNRCVVFATTATTFHGVTPLRCPSDTVRCTFAAYYYTREAPVGWDGLMTTRFRARPDERWKGWVMMPAQRVGHSIAIGTRRLASRFKRALQGY